MEARQLVEQALGAARAAADDAAAREARRMVEEGIREQGEELEQAETDGEGGTDDARRSRSGIGCGWPAVVPGEVLEVRADGKLVVAMGAMKMVVDADQATRTASATSSPSVVRSAFSVLLRRLRPRSRSTSAA